MRNLDLNALAVESFSTSVEGDPSQWTAMAEPTTGTMTLTNRVCCEAAGVEACTVREPCCDVTP